MPSQIKVDEIKNVAGQYKIKTNVFEGQTTAGSITVQGEGTATTNLQQGLAKQWCHFDGSASTLSLDDSFNTASLTDNSTGNYSAFFTSAMASNNTSVLGDSNAYREVNTEKNTARVLIYIRQSGTASTVQDTSGVRCATLGDLA
tara:strand:+ start:244 stop:678 length:435 start_codon:yes stop_codon:yes gene_type:complete